MENSIVHEFSELPDAASLELESWDLPKGWGLCVMGSSHEAEGIRAHDTVIKIHEFSGEDYVEHLYPIPRSIALFLRNEKKRGYDEAKQEIKRALGV